jgi:hypothetical protein
LWITGVVFLFDQTPQSVKRFKRLTRIVNTAEQPLIGGHVGPWRKLHIGGEADTG